MAWFTTAISGWESIIAFVGCLEGKGVREKSVEGDRGSQVSALAAVAMAVRGCDLDTGEAFMVFVGCLEGKGVREKLVEGDRGSQVSVSKDTATCRGIVASRTAVCDRRTGVREKPLAGERGSHSAVVSIPVQSSYCAWGSSVDCRWPMMDYEFTLIGIPRIGD